MYYYYMILIVFPLIFHGPKSNNILLVSDTRRHKEALLRDWYNIAPVTLLSDAKPAGQSDGALLLETDSEADERCEDQILFETDSECEAGPSHPEENEVQELLLMTDSDQEVESDVPEQAAKRRKYAERTKSQTLKFLGKDVCKRAHMRLYAIGSGAVQKLRQGHRAYTMQDGRMEEPKHATLGTSLVRSSLQKKWPNIMSFFWLLYVSCAEILPTNFVMPTTIGVGKLAETRVASDPDFQDRYISQFMRTLENNYDTVARICLMKCFCFAIFQRYLGLSVLCGGKPCEVSPGSGPGTFSGPARYLEWMRPIDLFMQYQSFCEAINDPPASFSTFRRLMKSIFGCHLKFRDKGSFSQCTVCFNLRRKIRQSRNKFDRAAATRLYSKHLLAQWLDRVFYWSQRSMSRQYFSQGLHFSKKFSSDLSSSLVTIIQDGMDQSKLRIPRWGYGRMSKDAEKLYRPALHLVASWAHGWKLGIHLSCEDMKKNSVTSIEVLCKSLCDILSGCGSMPLGIYLQHDNTYREAKNKYMLNFLLMLQLLGVARVVTMGFLRVSHSHEDVDQAFGQISRLLAGKTLMSDQEVLSLLNECFRSAAEPGEKSGRLRGANADAVKLDQTALWKEFVRQTSLNFKGLRHVHYFKFTLRKDLGSNILDNILNLEEFGRGRLPHEDDVFLVTKRWLADSEVLRAMVVVPAAVATQIRLGYHPPAGVADRRAITEQVSRNISKRVPKLARSGKLTGAGANYLLKWSTCVLPHEPRPTSYCILNHRYDREMRNEIYHPGSWLRPHRVRHFDLSAQPDPDAAGSESSDSDGAVELPVGFEV